MPSNETLLKRNVVLNGSARENETVVEVVEEEQPSRKKVCGEHFISGKCWHFFYNDAFSNVQCYIVYINECHNVKF